MGDEIGTMAHAAIHDILDHRLTPDSDRAAKRANFDVTTQVIQTLEYAPNSKARTATQDSISRC